METDKKLKHSHSIKKNDKITTVPEHYGNGDDKKTSLFQRQGQPDKNGKVLLIPTLISADLLSPQFLDYWPEISYLSCKFWQRWFHTHKFSIVLCSRRQYIPHDLFLLSTTLSSRESRLTRRPMRSTADWRSGQRFRLRMGAFIFLSGPILYD